MTPQSPAPDCRLPRPTIIHLTASDVCGRRLKHKHHASSNAGGRILAMISMSIEVILAAALHEQEAMPIIPAVDE